MDLDINNSEHTSETFSHKKLSSKYTKMKKIKHPNYHDKPCQYEESMADKKSNQSFTLNKGIKLDGPDAYLLKSKLRQALHANMNSLGSICVTGRPLTPFIPRLQSKERTPLLIRRSISPKFLSIEEKQSKNLQKLKPNIIKFSLKCRNSSRKSKSIAFRRRSPVIRNEYSKLGFRLASNLRLEKL